jgi:hypothetical protein
VQFIVLNPDPIYIVNLILCIIIVTLGIFIYLKKGDLVPIYIGIAFGLFGISHAATILGLKGEGENFLIVVRLLAYLVIIYALFKILNRKTAVTGGAQNMNHNFLSTALRLTPYLRKTI